MKAKIYSLSVLLTFYFAGLAQDPFFPNPNQSLLFLNPSFAGSSGGFRNQSSYNNIPTFGSRSAITYANSSDWYAKRLKAGIGVSFLGDNTLNGLLKSSAINLSYAQHLSFFENKLKIIPSVQLGYASKTLDASKVTFGDLIDPRLGTIYNGLGFINKSKQYFDISSGLLVNYKNDLYAGISVFHLNRPDAGMQGVNPMPVNFIAHASYNLHVLERVPIKLSTRYSKQGANSYGQVSVDAVLFKHLMLGLGAISGRYNAMYGNYNIATSHYYLNNSNVLLFNLGYRNNFMTATVTFLETMEKGRVLPYYNGLGLSLGFYIRNKEQRKQLIW